MVPVFRVRNRMYGDDCSGSASPFPEHSQSEPHLACLTSQHPYETSCSLRMCDLPLLWLLHGIISLLTDGPSWSHPHHERGREALTLGLCKHSTCCVSCTFINMTFFVLCWKSSSLNRTTSHGNRPQC